MKTTDETMKGSDMNQELKQKWIEALKSGKFTQGYGRLRTEEGKYCCLGVFCEVSGIGINEDGMGAGQQPGYRELTDISPSAQFRLWQMNDSRSKTFPEIADWISANL